MRILGGPLRCGIWSALQDLCVRVGRQCHQSGGTDVVDLPDILLLEDHY